MSVIQTDLRVNPVAAARNVSYAPTAPLTAITVQAAIDQLQGEITVGSVTPPAIVPTPVTFAQSPYTVLSTDYLLEVDTTGGAVTIQTAASASRGNKPFTVKDIAGNSAVNAISILRTGAETIDGMTSYPMDSAYDAKTFKPKLAGTGYEVEA
jgi:hypothetical protein